jgi:GNAT superfamily N-acetyltransferase
MDCGRPSHDSLAAELQASGSHDHCWRNVIEYTIAEVGPDSREATTIQAGLYAADAPDVAARDYGALAFVARDEAGEVAGGLLGATMWGWLTVDALWVAPAARGAGLGGRLLAAAEAAALGRGCAHSRLDTFDFQARDFYERRGYAVYGQLADFPPGHVQHHLRKALLPVGTPAA